MLIPAHIWTPWFSVFGANSGFNSLEEAYGNYTEKITALETGLSSDPAMNWLVSQTDRFSLVSNSDSHSLSRIGREANVFNCELNYWEIKKVLKNKDREKFLYTVEFFPEEGKYHYDGHRICQKRLHPDEAKAANGKCPSCGRPLTRGVLSRVQELADRPSNFTPKDAIGFKNMVPLDEIIAETKGVAAKSKAVEKEYLDIVNTYGSEFTILITMSSEELYNKLPPRVAEGIIRVRDKKLTILPGYDGEYGIVKIFDQKVPAEETKQQFTLF
jgi:uncharacterized protein (TIGR00375 family)